jgi:hypothetical protein
MRLVAFVTIFLLREKKTEREQRGKQFQKLLYLTQYLKQCVFQKLLRQLFYIVTFVHQNQINPWVLGDPVSERYHL